MANPRKFSEKIALHTQKQAEETSAFEQIMREVQTVTTAPQQVQQRDQSPTVRQPQPHLLNTITNAHFRGGSLPNVNQMAQRGDRTQSCRQVGNLSTSPRASQSKLGPIRQKVRSEVAPYASPPSLSQLNTAAAGGISPTLCPAGSYGTNYLLPPSESAWRRANSDSAINSINSTLMIPSVVPDSSEESSNNSNDPRDGFVLSGSNTAIHQQHIKSIDGSGVIPTTVGEGPSLLEIPTSVSTGSLPDLTTFPFPTSIHQPPVEIEDLHNNTSPYSTSPLSYSHSPTSCSPHSQQPSQQPTVTGSLPQQISQLTQQQQHGLSQQQQHQQQQQQQQPQRQQPPRSPIQQRQQQQQQQQQHQHPSQQQQHSPQQQQQGHSSPQQQPQQQHSNPSNSLLDNPLSVNTSFQQQTFPQNDNMLTAYRCPPRPSPQNSPSPFRSPSPHDGQLSAPPSPSNQPQSADSFFLSQQANALQQHFEQISMQGGANSGLYFCNSGQQQIGATAGVTAQQSPSHHQQPQTPQTPSQILPDIIFTEFLGTDCTDPLEDFLTSEAAAAAFREGLGPIDTGDFQMLADPNLVLNDPQAEDTFRLDRL